MEISPTEDRMKGTGPTASAAKVVDLGFMDARSKLLDIAAFLDRVDRAGGSDDFRLLALKEAIRDLSINDPARTRRILEGLSDRSTEPAAAATTQSACGAPQPS
jgi:hypothetical protein